MQTTIVNCWQHTGILPSDNSEVSLSCKKIAEPEVEVEVQGATEALQQLNLTVSNQRGSQHLLPKPQLIEDIEELLADPNAPEWVGDESELELIKMVSNVTMHSKFGTHTLLRFMSRTKIRKQP